jgi:hypothetical protein
VNYREGSKFVSEDGPALRITEVARTYRVVYVVETYARDERTVTTERVWVRRPFQSRVETRRGSPPGTSELSLRQSAFGVLASTSENAQPLNIAAPPALSSGDLRMDAVLAEAVDDKIIERRERREVYGRVCQVYRAGGPVLAGDIERYERGSDEYADICVDRNGLVIEEAWTSDDRFLRRRAAVDVDVNPSIDQDLFDIEAPAEEGPLRGTVQRVAPGTIDADKLWSLRKTPKGFSYRGKYAVIRSSATGPQQQPGTQAVAPTSTSDVYTRGADLVVVDQDPSLIQAIRSEDRPAQPIRLKGFDRAELVIDARMSEVRGETSDDSVVRIYGTLPPSELLELARNLRAPSS